MLPDLAKAGQMGFKLMKPFLPLRRVNADSCQRLRIKRQEENLLAILAVVAT